MRAHGLGVKRNALVGKVFSGSVFSTQERKETATLEHARDIELFCSP